MSNSFKPIMALGKSILIVIILVGIALFIGIMGFIIPVAIIFTGLWFIWFINQDYENDEDNTD